MTRRYKRTFIREWRLKRGLTQEQLASRLDVRASHISMLETGKRGYTQETLEAVAEWDNAAPGQRRQIVEIAKTLFKTGS